MKLARIILPERDNQGESLSWQHQALQNMLVARYGGFTMTQGQGGWKSPEGRAVHEPVWVYDVAMKNDEVVYFRTLARDIAGDARQECVMIVTPQGEVEFVKPLVKEEV